MINLHLLRIFEAVALSRSFSQAADTLYISQPAVSKGVRELERQLGVALLDRSRRTIRMTEAGQLLHHYAQQLFAIERAAETGLAQLRELGQGRLALGASSTIGTYMLPSLLGAFRQRYPGVQLMLDIDGPERLIERLRKEPLDTVFVEGPIDDTDLLVAPWRTDTLVVVAAAHHPLLEWQPLGVAELLDMPFVLHERGSGTREVVEAALRERCVSLRVVLELGSTETVKQAVCAGLGLAIVSTAAIELERVAGKLVVLDVPDLVIQHTLAQVSARGPVSRTLDAFRAMLAA